MHSTLLKSLNPQRSILPNQQPFLLVSAWWNIQDVESFKYATINHLPGTKKILCPSPWAFCHLVRWGQRRAAKVCRLCGSWRDRRREARWRFRPRHRRDHHRRVAPFSGMSSLTRYLILSFDVICWKEKCEIMMASSNTFLLIQFHNHVFVME